MVKVVSFKRLYEFTELRTCFGYRAGYDPAAEPVFGAYSLKDKEDFIR